MILIDYLYYQLTNLYRYFNKDGAEKGYGVIMTCGLPCWNLVFLIIILKHFFNMNLGPSNKYFLVLYCLPIIILIGLRYWKYTSYENIKERIQDFSKSKRIISDILLIIYIIISLPLFVAVGFYIGLTVHK